MVMGNLNFGGVVVREFLDLPHTFHAFSGMPVSREFRYFIKNGSVLCRHPYWFPSCMRRVTCEDWLPKLKKIQVLNKTTMELCDEYALKISKAVKKLTKRYQKETKAPASMPPVVKSIMAQVEQGQSGEPEKLSKEELASVGRELESNRAAIAQRQVRLRPTEGYQAPK